MLFAVQFTAQVILPLSQSHLQPHVLGSSGDGGDLELHQPPAGAQLAGVHVVLRGQLCLDPNGHSVRGAAIRVRHLHLEQGQGSG